MIFMKNEALNVFLYCLAGTVLGLFLAFHCGLWMAIVGEPLFTHPWYSMTGLAESACAIFLCGFFGTFIICLATAIGYGLFLLSLRVLEFVFRKYKLVTSISLYVVAGSLGLYEWHAHDNMLVVLPLLLIAILALTTGFPFWWGRSNRNRLAQAAEE